DPPTYLPYGLTIHLLPWAHIVLRILVDSSGKIHGKQDFPLDPEAELPVQVVDGVELSAVVRHASFPYDTSQLAPAVLDIANALLLVVDVAFASTDLLLVQPPVLLLYTSLTLRTFFEL
ncbi:hypothetical protein A2U01_0061459, partial [Trifolium medium]|nr:hypothetical protein [Trifolium medium]